MWIRVLLNFVDIDYLDIFCVRVYYLGVVNNVNSIYGEWLGFLGGESIL